ncbi:MAG: caspase family protein [Pseudomonadota bacterium]
MGTAVIRGQLAAIAALALSIAALAAAPSASAQGFDCARATTAIENAICADDRLGKLDERLNARYRQLRRAAPEADRDALRAEQRQWLEERRRLCDGLRERPMRRCLVQVYRDRLQATRVVLDRYRAERAARRDDRPSPPQSPPPSSTPPSAGAGCVAQSQAFSAARAALGVAIDDASAQVGAPFAFSWRDAGYAADAPAYLVIAFDRPVRFAGDGFYALTPGAAGPLGLSAFQDQTRVLVPLFGPDGAAEGAVRIRPLVAEPLTIRWDVLGFTDCEEIAAEPVEAVLEVAPGAPSIQIENLFPTEEVERRIVAPDGRSALQIAPSRFRLVDLATDRQVFEASGRDPQFAPGGRFLLYYRGNDLILVDVAAREEIYGYSTLGAETPGAWDHNGSFFILEMLGYGGAELVQTLIDDRVIAHGDGVPPDKAAEGALRIDLDRGHWLIKSVNNGQAPTAAAYALTGARAGCVADAVASADNACRAPEDWFVGFPERAMAGYRPPTTWELSDAAWVTPNFCRYLNDCQPFVATFAAPDQSAAPTPTLASETAGAQGGVRTRSARSALPPPAPIGPFAMAERLSALGIERQYGEALDPGAVPAGPERTIPKDGLDVFVMEDLKARQSAVDPDLFIAGSYEGCAAFDDKGPQAVFVGADFDQIRYRRGETAEGPFEIISDACRQGSLGVLAHSTIIARADHAGAPFEISRAVNENPGYFYTTCEENLFSCAYQVALFHGRYLLFWSREGRAVAVFDLKDWRLTSSIVGIPRGEQAADYSLSPDGRWITQINDDGSFALLDVSKPQQRDPNAPDDQARAVLPETLAEPIALDGFYIDDELVVWRDGVVFDATYEGASMVSVRFAGRDEPFALSQFESQFRVRGLARQVLEDRYRRPDLDSGLPPGLDADLGLAGDGRLAAEADLAYGGPIQQIRLYQDGVPTGVYRPGPDGGVAIAADRLPGARWATLIAEDPEGLLSAPASVDLGRDPNGGSRTHVLAVGVDRYRDPQLTPLGLTVADANRFQQLFAPRSNGGLSNVLTDFAATRDLVIAALEATVEAAEPGDSVMLFLSGHGVQDASGQFYFATHDTEIDRLAETALPWSVLSEIVGRSKTRVLVFLDSCHSGAAGQGLFATNDDAADALLDQAPTGVVVFSASKGRQLAEENTALGGGVFTVALAEVVGPDGARFDLDQNGAIEISEFYAGVKSEVVKNTEGRQTPWFVRNELVGDFKLFELD